MLLANIDDLVHTRTIEGSRVEYKKGWNPERVAHTICAFANDIENIGGGYIIIGIDEKDGMPVFPISGIERSSIDRINKELMGICNLIDPRYIPATEHAIIDGKDILVIEALTGPNRPYKCPDRISKDKNDRTGKSYYIRKLSSTISASPDEERVLFETSAMIPFDCRVNNGASITDIREWLIREYVSKVDEGTEKVSGDVPLDVMMRNLKIVGQPPDDRRPINAGILFFNEKPERFIDGARIEIIFMPEPTGEGMRETVIDGPLDIQLETAVEILRTRAVESMLMKRPDSPISDVFYNYPLIALKELITNAVYHKDYSVNEPVTVTVRPDRITVQSIPGPDRSITDKDIREYRMSSTRYRNARIGDLLKHRRLAEKRGTGIPTILAALESNGSEPPLFETDAERSFFRATLFINKLFLKKDVSNPPIDKPKDLGISILKLLRDNGPMSMREVCERLGYSRNAQNVYKTVRTMIEDGMVEHTIPDKVSSKNQKIRIRIDRSSSASDHKMPRYEEERRGPRK